MKSTFFFTIFLGCASEINSLRNTVRYSTINAHAKHPRRPYKSRPLSVIDEVNHLTSTVFVDNLNSGGDITQAANDMFQGFTSSFSSRFIGTVLGNIAAAIFLKFTTDFLWSKARDMISSTASSFTTSKPTSGVEKKLIVDEQPLPSNAYFLLILCIIIDLVGDSSFALPGVGEVEDAVWAPASAYVLANIFNSNAITTIDFIKELLPGIPVIVLCSVITDFIQT